jgi:hypothetical protein
VSLARGGHEWRNVPPGEWDADVARLFAALAALDAELSSKTPLRCSPEQLFQGPIADALTHVGQLAMLRRLAGLPVRGENYFKAHIAAGRIGLDQPPPGFEFD